MRPLLLLFVASFAITFWWCREGPAAPGPARDGPGMAAAVAMGSAPGPDSPVPVSRAEEAPAGPSADEPDEAVQESFEPVVEAALMAEDPAERQQAIRRLADAPAAIAISALVEVLRISDDESDLAAARWALEQQDRSPALHGEIAAALQL